MTCPACGRETPVAKVTGVCGNCIRTRPGEFLEPILLRHRAFREEHGLPPEPPRSKGGEPCGFCARECVLGREEPGYCGARVNREGKIEGGVKTARVSWYYDPLPTNCVADWVCPEGGNERKTRSVSPAAKGLQNLAVFYEACNFHCLNCQNWHFRERGIGPGMVTPETLAGAATADTACICFFGGDPGPSLLHSIKAARLARRSAGDRPLRICWETNGSVKQSFLKGMLGLALDSGGVIKFDLKAFSPHLHLALTGAGNRRTLDNFGRLAHSFDQRKDHPLLAASTLLVPGLVDEDEVAALAGYIASFSPDIPYALLAFHPDCRLRDLPPTSRDHAEASLSAAKKAGLKNVRLGNIHLIH